MSKTVFFDESGYTGNDLLNHETPFFCLSSVMIEESEADDIVKYIFQKHRLQGAELKGRNMFGKNPKIELAIELLKIINGKFAFSISDKQLMLCMLYSRAGKINNNP